MTRALLTLALLAGCAEPGFMAVRPHWGRTEFPLAVCAQSYASTEDVDPLVSRVIRTINDRLGFKAYALHPGSEGCAVLAVLGVPADSTMEPGGEARISETGIRCSIRTANAHGEVLSLVVQHELCHCMGLDHDDWAGSIMRRRQTETPDWEFPPWITDGDRALLREEYGP